MNVVRNAPCNAVCNGVTRTAHNNVRGWVQSQSQTVLKHFCGCFWSRSKIIIKAVDVRGPAPTDDDFAALGQTNHTPTAVAR